MISTRHIAPCLIAVLVLGCAPTKLPTINTSNEGMIALEAGKPVFDVKTKSLMYMPKVRPTIGNFKTRMAIGVDGKVRNAIYVDGDKSIWHGWERAISKFELSVSPEVGLGPWELDMIVEIVPSETVFQGELRAGYRTVFRHISYRKVVQSPTPE